MWCHKCCKAIKTKIMDTDKCVPPPLPFVYWFGLQNIRCQKCCRAIKTKIMDTDKHVLPPIPFVYWFELQNMKRHKCCRVIKTKIMDTDKCVLPPIPFAYWFELQNMRCHKCCRAIKTKIIRVAYQCPLQNLRPMDGVKNSFVKMVSHQTVSLWQLWCQSRSVSERIWSVCTGWRNFQTFLNGRSRRQKRPPSWSRSWSRQPWRG